MTILEPLEYDIEHIQLETLEKTPIDNRSLFELGAYKDTFYNQKHVDNRSVWATMNTYSKQFS